MCKGRIASFLTFYLASPAGVGVGGGGFGGLILDKFLYKEDPLQGSTPYPLYTIFDRKSIPVVYFVLTNGTHLTLYMLCLFNINKYF